MKVVVGSFELFSVDPKCALSLIFHCYLLHLVDEFCLNLTWIATHILSFLVVLLDDWLCSCLTLCKLYFFHDGYDYSRFYQVVGFLSLWFCCSIGWLLLKAAVFVLLVLHWLLLLLCSSWFGWLKLHWQVLGLFFWYLFTTLKFAIFACFLSPNLLDCYFLVFAYLFFEITIFSRR